MARYDSPRKPAAQRALAVLALAGAALGAGTATAAADAARAATDTVGHVTGPAADLKPNPLAGTGVDPLDNGVGTQVADFQPVESRALTAPVAQAPSIGSVPVAGQVTKLPSR